MYSVKKKSAKDRIEQDTCEAIEDYLRESEKKDNLKNEHLLLSLYKKKQYKMTSIKNISISPIIEDNNFTVIINKYLKSDVYKNSTDIFNEKETSKNDYRIINQKNKIIMKKKEKELRTPNTEKVEILEDGSICIKNTTGMISPSLGEKYVEIKNSINEDINNEIDQDILGNSKLLVSNNIKSLEEYDNDNNDNNEYSEHISINNKALTERNNNIFDDNNNFNSNSNSNMYETFPNILKENNNNFHHGIYFSTSKKNKIKSKNNNMDINVSSTKGINGCKRKISTNVRKKKLIKSFNKSLNKNNNNINNSNENSDKLLLQNNNNFIKEIGLNNNNCNELNYKRVLFVDNLKEDEDVINQWKYLSNKYIKNYNKKLLSTNIQIITQNLKIQKILEQKNKYKNYPDDTNNEENNNNIENIDIHDNAAQTIEIIEYNNKTDSDSEFIFKPTNISYILRPPIITYNYSYENIFDEIDILSEENIKTLKNDSNNKAKKYQGDIESINEEINESYEEQESNDVKDDKKISNSNKKCNNKDELKIINKKIIINPPLIDNAKINFNISKINNTINNIEKIYNDKNQTKETEVKDLKDLDSLSYSPISATSSKIIFSKKKELNRIGHNKLKDRNNLSKDSKNLIDNEELSISKEKEKEKEMSDEEIIIDEKGKLIINNEIIKKFLFYKIEENNIDKDNKKSIKLLFCYNDKSPRYLININSYKKIVKMLFYKKRKPITKKSYESLISTIINNFSIFKKEYSLKNNNNNNYTQTEKEKINNNVVDLNKKIKELEENVKELKNIYIYVLIKKHLIKDKLEKKNFIKNLNISSKRNKIKRIYKDIINILNNKINDSEINKNYYNKMIDILKNYETINDNEIKEEKYKNNSPNEIIKNINNNNKYIINDNKKKIFVFLLPMMFIINYFVNNFKVYEYNNIV